MNRSESNDKSFSMLTGLSLLSHIVFYPIEIVIDLVHPLGHIQGRITC